MCPKASPIKYQTGIGLPGALFVITVLAMVVVAISRLGEGSATADALDMQSVRAFYAAESGAQIALNNTFMGTDSCGATSSVIYSKSNFAVDGLQTCSVSVSCISTLISGNKYYTLTSTATCGAGIDSAQRSIEVRAK